MDRLKGCFSISQVQPLKFSSGYFRTSTIALSVTEGVPANDGEITARANAIAANNNAAAVALFANWAPAVQNASRLVWVKRLAAETAMKRLSE